MQHIRTGAEVVPDDHASDDSIGCGADDLDPEQLGKGQRLPGDPLENFHLRPLAMTIG
jgi:hypothetical protein